MANGIQVEALLIKLAKDKVTKEQMSKYLNKSKSAEKDKKPKKVEDSSDVKDERTRKDLASRQKDLKDLNQGIAKKKIADDTRDDPKGNPITSATSLGNAGSHMVDNALVTMPTGALAGVASSLPNALIRTDYNMNDFRNKLGKTLSDNRSADKVATDELIKKYETEYKSNHTATDELLNTRRTALADLIKNKKDKALVDNARHSMNNSKSKLIELENDRKAALSGFEQQKANPSALSSDIKAILSKKHQIHDPAKQQAVLDLMEKTKNIKQFQRATNPGILQTLGHWMDPTTWGRGIGETAQARNTVMKDNNLTHSGMRAVAKDLADHSGAELRDSTKGINHWRGKKVMGPLGRGITGAVAAPLLSTLAYSLIPNNATTTKYLPDSLTKTMEHQSANSSANTILDRLKKRYAETGGN